MPRRLIKRYMPDHRVIREHRHLRHLGDRLHDPNLWHLNRRSVAGAVGIGLFVAFLPIPLQMLLAAALAVWARVNLPLAAIMVWVTNPLTMPPLFYFSYKVGALLTGTSPTGFAFEPTVAWLLSETGAIWRPFLLGCVILGALFGALGYGAVRLAWRLHVLRKRRQAAARAAPRPGDPTLP